MTDDARVLQLATQAAAHWGDLARPLRLIANRENAVFEAHLSGGAHVALRLHRPGYQSDAAIRSELAWTGLLAQAGFASCAPVPAQDGSVVVAAEGRMLSAVTWLAGKPMGAAFEPLTGTVAEQVRQFADLGRLVADLHNTTDALTFPGGFSRPHWDTEGFLGDAPLWDRFWDSPVLTPAEAQLLQEARRAAREVLDAFRTEGGDYGLIHADLLRENILVRPEGLALIDFDDCGFGFRMYDLGTALSPNQDEPGYDDLAAALIAGYRSARALPDRAASLLDIFVMLRAFASTGWCISRKAPDDPIQRVYAERAIRRAQAFLG